METADYDTCVSAIKAVDYNAGRGLELVVMLGVGEELAGEGE